MPAARQSGEVQLPSLTPSLKLVQKLLPAPLAFGAADVDLITGTETSPNITQSETYTTANPDNPNQIVVAYNDSRGAATNQLLRRIVSPPTAARPSPASPTPAVKALCQYLWRPRCSVQQTNPTWFTVWLDAGCGGQGMAATSPPLRRTRIAGPISAFTPAAATTASLAGRTTTHPLHSSGGCTFPGTTSMSAAAPLRHASPLTTVPLGQRSDTVTNSTFIRNVQITGDKVNGRRVHRRHGRRRRWLPSQRHQQNLQLHRRRQHLDQHLHRPTFPGPGVTAVGYFACMFTASGGYWRHKGWGEPAAYNHVVTLSMPSTAPAPTLATSFTFVPLTAA